MPISKQLPRLVFKQVGRSIAASRSGIALQAGLQPALEAAFSALAVKA